jgi:hypothetical protein
MAPSNTSPTKESETVDKSLLSLASAIVGNIATANIPLDDVELHLRDKTLIPRALLRGFARPRVWSQAEVNLNAELARAVEYATVHLGEASFDARSFYDWFSIPAHFPWPSVTAVFVPTRTNIKRATQPLRPIFNTFRCDVEDNVGVRGYPRLYFTPAIIEADDRTVGLDLYVLPYLGYRYLDTISTAVALGINKLLGEGGRDPFTRAKALLMPDDLFDGAMQAIAWFKKDFSVFRASRKFCSDAGAIVALEAPLKKSI